MNNNNLSLLFQFIVSLTYTYTKTTKIYETLLFIIFKTNWRSNSATEQTIRAAFSNYS